VVLREISLFKFSHLTKNKGGFCFRFSSISRCLLIQPLKTTYLLKHIYMFYRKGVTERMNFDYSGCGWLMNFKYLFLFDRPSYTLNTPSGSSKLKLLNRIFGFQFKTSSKCSIGKWKIAIDSKRKDDQTAVSYAVKQPIYILFNPWNSGML
jgi:hypothetical protein